MIMNRDARQLALVPLGFNVWLIGWPTDEAYGADMHKIAMCEAAHVVEALHACQQLAQRHFPCVVCDAHHYRPSDLSRQLETLLPVC